ncbi:uncharacterized protein K441DRAFT_675028 [Cenococcum geophilum 1.58]|uniref:uncharacterized protein n=1 Tax=Cenococcum geophilum 1.58 TaxID=794803 RepID=UPI00358EAF1F|nr:hypothetical protein K441DRAFT_675028 [Cenococcum geophilum 1.58]
MGAFVHRHLSSDVVYEQIPPNPSETLVLGSDDECELEQRAAKRLRIERIATQYLHETTPLILSAALKGPLDKSWGNPWARNTVFDRYNPAGRAKRLRDEILRRRARDKAKRRDRRRMQEIELSQRMAELRKDGPGKSVAQPVEAYGGIGLEKHNSKPHHSAVKVNSDYNPNNRTSRREPSLGRPIAQDGKALFNSYAIPTSRKTGRGTNQWLRCPRESENCPEMPLKSAAGEGGERASDDRLTPSKSPDQKPLENDSHRQSNDERTKFGLPRDTHMPSTILKSAVLDRVDPRIHRASFTPINRQPSITASDSIPVSEFAFLHSDEENWSSLQEAKRLSQRAVKKALTPAPQLDSRYADISIMKGYQSAKKLSRKGAELALAAIGQDDKDFSPLKTEVQHSAERCVKIKTSKPKASRAIRGTKKAKIKGQGTEARKEETPQQIPHDHLNDSNDDASTRSLKYPHLASPTPASSLGFVYRKVGAKDAELNQPLTAAKSKVPQKRRPRSMTFESSPTSLRTSISRKLGGMDEHDIEIKKKKANPAVANYTLLENDQMLLERNTVDRTAHCIGVGDLGERMKTQPPEGSGELAASTDDHAEVSNEGEAVVVEDGLITKSRDLSTQAAMVMARREFQEEVGSFIHEINSLPDGYTDTPTAQANNMSVTAITPFHAFNTESNNLVVNQKTRAEMPMSTQDLFNATSPFAWSTARKKRHRPSFVSLQVETREDSEVEGNDLKWRLSDDERRHVQTFENDDDTAGKPNPSQSGGRCEDDNCGAVRSSAQSQSLINRSPLKERNIGTSFHNSSSSQPKPSQSQVTTFSITPSGPLKEVSYQDGQRLLADIDLNAELDFAGSFLQSWDTDSLIRK